MSCWFKSKRKDVKEVIDRQNWELATQVRELKMELDMWKERGDRWATSHDLLQKENHELRKAILTLALPKKDDK